MAKSSKSYERRALLRVRRQLRRSGACAKQARSLVEEAAYSLGVALAQVRDSTRALEAARTHAWQLARDGDLGDEGRAELSELPHSLGEAADRDLAALRGALESSVAALEATSTLEGAQAAMSEAEALTRQLTAEQRDWETWEAWEDCSERL